MTYQVVTDENLSVQVYKKIDEDGLCRTTCIGIDKNFQQWLRDNEDNLPSDIQAKIDDGTLTIQEAD